MPKVHRRQSGMPSMSRLATVVGVAAMALSMTMVNVSAQSSGEDVLRIGRPDDVRALNPFRQANNGTTEVTYQIHEGLVTVTPDQKVVPVLATGWEVLEDGLTYRISLREDVSFHSGAPFNAEAVAWNMDMQFNSTPPGIASGLIPALSAISVVDEYTVDFTLEQPSGVFMAILGAPLFMIVDPTVYAEVGEEGYNNAPSGTGPFKFESWSPGENVTLVANDNYWDTENGPAVDRVVFEVIPEASARTIALQNGEIDIAFSVPAEQMEMLGSQGFKTYSVPSTRVLYIGLNTVDPVLEDVDVRAALGHAMNREMIISIIGKNGSLAEGIGMDGVLGYFPSARAYDPGESNALLDGAGWTMGNDGIRTKDGSPLEITVWTQGSTPGEIEALQVAQQQWQAVGARMIIERIEGGTMYADLTAAAGAHTNDPTQIPGYQGFVVNDGIRTAEVGYITERPKCDQGARGYERYCNPDYDAGFNLSQSPVSVEERLVGYKAMADLFYQDVMRLPLFVLQVNTASSDAVQGFGLNPSTSLSLRGVSLSE